MSARVSRMRREDLPGANRFHRHQTTKTSPVPLASPLFVYAVYKGVGVVKRHTQR
jgi:hypothetical protein